MQIEIQAEVWVNVELWSCVAVSRWCFVYNMHQINIHSHFHKSTFFFKTVTERKIFFLVWASCLLSLVEVLLPFCMFWKRLFCMFWKRLHSVVVAFWQMFGLSLDLVKLRETEHRILPFCIPVCYCIFVTLPLGRDIMCVFFMSGKTKSLFWFRPFKNCLGCSQNRNVFIPLLLLFW